MISCFFSQSNLTKYFYCYHLIITKSCTLCRFHVSACVQLFYCLLSALLNKKFTNTADTTPSTAPARTSVGKCMKLYIRENAISMASTSAGIPILLSINISVTAAVMPFNVCPEGNDESNGIFTIRLTVSSL